MRIVLVTSLCLLFAAPVAANPDCRVFGEIVDKIVVQRQRGKDMTPAMQLVAQQFSDKEARFVPTIPYLADWVYTLPKDQLTDAAGKAFVAQCSTAH